MSQPYHTPDLRQSLTGFALVVLAAIGFSAKAILVKLAYRESVDALTLLALRMAFALPFFLLMGFLRKGGGGHKPLTVRDLLALVGLGLLGYYIASYLDFWGLEYISAGLERLILFLYPTLVLMLSSLLLGRKIGKREFLALLLSYGGIGFVFWEQIGNSQLDFWVGSSLVFASTIAYAFYLMSSHRYISKAGASRFTALTMSAASLAVLLHYGLSRPLTEFNVPTSVLGLALGMAIFSTVLPSLFLTMGIQRIGASRASLISSLGPVVTLICAQQFLGEILTFWQLVGAGLILIGVLAVSF